MNTQAQVARAAARAFYEAQQAFDDAKQALEPFAQKQIEITKKVVTECNLKDHYDYRAFFYHDWIELNVGGYYQSDSDIPVIECELWYRGRCGDPNSLETTFALDQHILNGQPELFEDALRAKLESMGQKKVQKEREVKEREIARLQAELNALQGAVK